MNVKNCRKCGKMFNYISGEQICPQCKEKTEEKFQEVKKYVQDHQKATLGEICETCEVDQKLVRQWVREERLFFSDDSPVKINCEICGAVINTGRYCAQCKKETVNGLHSATHHPETPQPQPEPTRTPSKMYTRR